MKLVAEKVQILLVDDSEVVRKRLKRDLAALDGPLEIFEASDGAMALSLLTELVPSATLIILDLQMPRMSGIECLEEIRSHEEWKNVHVVINSSTNDVKEVDRVATLGVIDIVPKPIPKRRLADILHQCFSGSHKGVAAPHQESRPLSILLADNFTAEREETTKNLLLAFENKVEVTPVKSGTEILEKVKEQDFDCMILDYHLLDTDGTTILRELREDGLSTPAIILTRDGDEAVAAAAIKSGASDYRKKSDISPHGLKWIVESAIEKLSLHKESETQKLRALKQARISALGTMAAGIAHEINNPLAIMQNQGFILEKMLRDGAEIETEKLHKISTTMVRTVERVAKIVKSLLMYSGSGKNNKPSLIEIEGVVTEVGQYFQQRAASEAIELRIDSEKIRGHAFANSFDLSQVLMSLWENAFWAAKGSPGEEKWIEITSVSLSEHTEIAVTDSGPGMDQATLSKIMDPFFTTKPTNQGAGLGLSIAQSLVQNMGGEIYFDSAKKNTCFVIRVPNRECLQEAA